jgi:hypothetical protein
MCSAVQARSSPSTYLIKYFNFTSENDVTGSVKKRCTVRLQFVSLSVCGDRLDEGSAVLALRPSVDFQTRLLIDPIRNKSY